MQFLIPVSLIWGLSFVIIKGSLASLDSSFVSFCRLVLSLLIFIPFLRPSQVARFGDRLLLMSIGAVQFGVMYLAYTEAFHTLPAHMIALLTTTTPIFVSIFSDISERTLNKTALLSAILAVAGGAVLEFPDQSIAANLRGIFLVQISNAAFAFGQITYRNWMRKHPGVHDRNVFAFLYAGAALVTGVFFLAAASLSTLSVEKHQWYALLYLGVIASGVSFFMWNSGARKVGAGMLAVMNNMKIPVAVIASVAILREHTEPVRLAGGCLLMAAALWAVEKGNRRRAGLAQFPSRNSQL